MGAYRCSIKSQLSAIFCLGVLLASISVSTVSIYVVYLRTNTYLDKTATEIENLQFVKNSYSLQSRGSMVQNDI